MKLKVKPEDLGKALNSIISEYTDEIVKQLPDVCKKAGKDGVRTLKSAATSAGIGGTKYKRSFRSKVVTENSRQTNVVIYSTKYRLTHLLENGHKIKNRRNGRIYGETRAFKHWAPAEAKIAKDLEEKVVEMVEKS